MVGFAERGVLVKRRKKQKQREGARVSKRANEGFVKRAVCEEQSGLEACSESLRSEKRRLRKKVRCVETVALEACWFSKRANLRVAACTSNRRSTLRKEKVIDRFGLHLAVEPPYLLTLRLDTLSIRLRSSAPRFGPCLVDGPGLDLYAGPRERSAEAHR